MLRCHATSACRAETTRRESVTSATDRVRPAGRHPPSVSPLILATLGCLLTFGGLLTPFAKAPSRYDGRNVLDVHGYSVALWPLVLLSAIAAFYSSGRRAYCAVGFAVAMWIGLLASSWWESLHDTRPGPRIFSLAPITPSPVAWPGIGVYLYGAGGFLAAAALAFVLVRGGRSRRADEEHTDTGLDR